MKVYIVMADDYDDHSIYGVFLDEAKADKRAEELAGDYIRFYVEECTVDDAD